MLQQDMSVPPSSVVISGNKLINSRLENSLMFLFASLKPM